MVERERDDEHEHEDDEDGDADEAGSVVAGDSVFLRGGARRRAVATGARRVALLRVTAERTGRVIGHAHPQPPHQPAADRTQQAGGRAVRAAHVIQRSDVIAARHQHARARREHVIGVAPHHVHPGRNQGRERRLVVTTQQRAEEGDKVRIAGGTVADGGGQLAGDRREEDQLVPVTTGVGVRRAWREKRALLSHRKHHGIQKHNYNNNDNNDTATRYKGS